MVYGKSSIQLIYQAKEINGSEELSELKQETFLYKLIMLKLA